MTRATAAPRILLVDSDDDLREAIGELFRERGFEVVEATAPEEAFALLEHRDVQVVLTNYRVRAADPRTFLAALSTAAAPAPVGLITAWPVSADEAAGRGLAFVLPQPLDAQALLARVAQAISLGPLEPAHARAVQAYFAALEGRDWDGLVSLCTEDVEYHLPGEHPRHSRSVRGRKAFRDFSEETFRGFPNARFRVDAVLRLPWGAVARYVSSWAVPGGERQELPGSVVFRFRHGQISEIGVRLEARGLDPVR